jgi:hypothetical protein
MPPVGTRRSAGSVPDVAPGGGIGRPLLSQLVRAVVARSTSNIALEARLDLCITPFIRSSLEGRQRFDAARGGS